MHFLEFYVFMSTARPAPMAIFHCWKTDSLNIYYVLCDVKIANNIFKLYKIGKSQILVMNMICISSHEVIHMIHTFSLHIMKLMAYSFIKKKK